MIIPDYNKFDKIIKGNQLAAGSRARVGGAGAWQLEIRKFLCLPWLKKGREVRGGRGGSAWKIHQSASSGGKGRARLERKGLLSGGVVVCLYKTGKKGNSGWGKCVCLYLLKRKEEKKRKPVKTCLWAGGGPLPRHEKICLYGICL